MNTQAPAFASARSVGMGTVGTHESGEEILRLTPNCDPSLFRFSPAEGYLLSRVDGYTPRRLLREIGGLPALEVDLCLESWLAQGILSADPAQDQACSRPAPAENEPESAATETSEAPLPPIDESLIDTALDVSDEVQRKILAMEAGLSRNLFEVLGVSRDSDSRDVKKAYFALCREFHPDRFFRRDIGCYAEKLDRIFKRVLEAYELLSDDDERRNLADALGLSSAPAESPVEEKSASPSSEGEEPDPGTEGPVVTKTYESFDAPTQSSDASSSGGPLTPLDRLKQRMPIRISGERQSQGKQQAEEIYKAALVSLRRGRHSEAIANVRLAQAFDQGNKKYRQTLDQIQGEAAVSRLVVVRERLGSMSRSENVKALRVCEEEILERPQGAEGHYLAARIAVELGEYAQAQGFSESAIELEASAAASHAVLGRAFEGQNAWAKAIAEFEEAVNLDPEDDDSTRRLAALKWRVRATRTQNGGTT
jgi:curved DNA-binding protein CbpA